MFRVRIVAIMLAAGVAAGSLSAQGNSRAKSKHDNWRATPVGKLISGSIDRWEILCDEANMSTKQRE